MAMASDVVTGTRMDPALQAPEVNTIPGITHEFRTRRWQGIPTLERSASGRLWAAWYSGGTGEGPDNYVTVATSDDDGHSWREPVLVIDPPGQVRAYDPCMWIDPLGRLWLFWAQSERWWDGRGGVWATRNDRPDDAAALWTTPRRICDGVMMNKPTVLFDGTWLLPVGGWHAIPPRHPAVTGGQLSYVVASTDQGQTFTCRGGADVPDRSFDEHMVVQRRDGSLWMLVRLNRGVGESFSYDNGYTWLPGRTASIAGPGSRFFIHRLRSGALLLINHLGFEKNKNRRSNLTASVSDDDGRSWHGHLMLDDRDNVSYPDAIETTDDVIYAIHDRSRPGDKEILLSVFTEADVRAGKLVGGRSRLRVRISPAQ